MYEVVNRLSRSRELIFNWEGIMGVPSFSGRGGGGGGGGGGARIGQGGAI